MNPLNAALIATIASLIPLSSAGAADDVVIVYDASGSMWGQIDGVTKIEIARDVMADLVHGWSEDTHLGLVAYGHRSEGDCGDIETLIEPKRLDRDGFINTVNNIRPKGKTPISAAVQHAADLLSYRDNPATVVLISDGLETCQADPCALSEQLAQQGVKFTAHVVGFDLEDAAHARLACIAENTGGVFVPAQNAAELKDALAHVQSIMDLQPMAEPQPDPTPVPKSDAEIEIKAPEQVTTGASFTVSWTATVNPNDYVTIVPAGADEGKYTNYQRVHDNREAKLIAPADPGLYEARYVLQEGGRTLASTPVEVVAAEVGIAAPEQVTTGASFTVSWTATVNPNDYVTIVPAGADEGKYTNYQRVHDNREAKLIAPADPGLYEARYVLQEGGRTLASTPVEVVAAEVGIAAPEQVTTGASFTVSWTATVNPNDYVTIVPAGADEGKYTNYQRVHDNREAKLIAPADPGLYEARYVLQEGGRTLASTPVEVVAAEVGIAAPEQVTTGASFTVSWTATVNPNDYVTIVPAGADEGKYTNYQRVHDNREAKLIAPADPGLYEARYVLQEGGRTLASTPVEVVAADVTVNGPRAARAGSNLRINWSASIHPDDYITIVAVGADEGKYGTYIRVHGKFEGDIKAPTETGLYEVRYVLREGGRTLASYQLEVVPEDAPLDEGAGISAPTQARAGETITVTWSGGADSADQRISIARQDQADFSWIAAYKVGAEQMLELQMPTEGGTYEVRFLDVSGRKVLGRSIVEVK
ncbi:VWA domain-containing protein [Falsochrobactrum ovis]|uniref:vWA domain-containing protein n=5 Tax=Falsochrobactrum ovis TaxID=1293442 RepID=UPI00361270B7